MEYRRGSPPEDYPVIRPPPTRPPPGRPPPPPPPARQVHFEDRPRYLASPPRGHGAGAASPPSPRRFVGDSRGRGAGAASPPSPRRFVGDSRGRGAGAASPPSPRRFVGDSPPQRYLEGPPQGYQESPPRRFPILRRSNPNAPPPQYLSPEDSPPYRYSEDAPRRFPIGRGAARPFSEDEPLPPDIDGPPPPGFRDEAPRRFGGNPPARGMIGHGRDYSDSESQSPPPGYFRPPPPPPGGFIDDSPRRFGRSPHRSRQFGRYAEDLDSPPTRYADEDPRRFGGGARRPYDRSPPSPAGGYAEDQPRRFVGTPPQFRDDSPPHYADEAPRRFGGSPPRPPTSRAPRGPPEDPNRGGAPAPARRPGGPPPPPPGYERGGRGDTSPPPPRFEGEAAALPPRGASNAPPPRRPGGPPPPPPGYDRGDTSPPPRGFAAAPPPRRQEFADGSPPHQGPHGYKDNPPGRLAAEPRQFSAAAAGAGLAGYAEEVRSREARGGPPPEPPTPGFGPPGGGGGPIGAQPRPYTGGPPPPRPPGSPGPPDPSAYIGLGTPSREGFPPGGPPPGPDPRVHSSPGSTPPRFPPELSAAGALVRRPPTPSSADSSPPGLVRYSGDDPLPLRTPGSTSPSFGDLGGRFEPSNDIYRALPPHATPPRQGYHPPPPGLGQGGDAPLLGIPPGYATPERGPPARVGPDSSPPIPDFLFARPQRRHPDGYRASTPPREPPPRPPGLGRDAIFTAAVVPIQLDEKLKDVQPHGGNPGSQTGGAWKDLWAALLFILHLGAIAALCIIFGLQGLLHTIKHYNDPNTFHINDWLPPLALAVATGAVFAVAWQNFIRMAPVLMILVTVWTGAAVMILVGIVLIATGQTIGLVGIAFFFAGICQALYAFIVRDRLPFAGVMLKKVISVCNAYPSTYGVSYSFLLVSLVWMAVWIFGVSGCGLRRFHALIILGFLASLLWTMQVLRNIVRVTVAGTVALFYFQEHNMPPSTTPLALLKSCTSSLGSICFGSFFVPLVEAPCHVLRRINAQAGTSEFLFSCVVCYLACFEYLIQYFNKLGYIQVAVYGKPFLRASKDTWDMLRAQEVDLLVDDDLTSTILFMACGLGGSLSALVGGIYTFVAHKSLTIVISVISYVIGALISYITMAVVESAVATYYVCFAEEPDSLQRHDGPLYERMWVRQMELQAPSSELAD